MDVLRWLLGGREATRTGESPTEAPEAQYAKVRGCHDPCGGLTGSHSRQRAREALGTITPPVDAMRSRLPFALAPWARQGTSRLPHSPERQDMERREWADCDWQDRREWPHPGRSSSNPILLKSASSEREDARRPWPGKVKGYAALPIVPRQACQRHFWFPLLPRRLPGRVSIDKKKRRATGHP